MLLRSAIVYAGTLAIVSLALFGALAVNAANKSERRLAIYNIHTKETLDIVYMRDGKRIPAAMTRINWAMRDYRENEPTQIDPKLIDLMWEIHTELGSREPIHLISGYRSKKTNAMLRRTRGGQAKRSRHMLGKAADIHFPDVPVRRLRYSGLIRQRGGVGYYPTSGIPFVHLDTGRVRHWPRMGRYELALLFPNGRSLHRPRGGRRITKRDVKIARSKHKDLSLRVAAFFDQRGQPAPPRPTLVAAATRSQFTTKVTFADTAQQNAPNRPTLKPSPNVQVASLGPLTLRTPNLAPRPTRAARPQKAPRLTTRPHLADRPSTLKPKSPSNTDRRKLTELFTLASLVPSATRIYASLAGTNQQAEIKPPTPTEARPHQPGETPTIDGKRQTKQQTQDSGLTIESILAAFSRDQSTPKQGKNARAGKTSIRSASLTPDTPRTSAPVPVPAERSAWASGWVTAPAYDDEHPEELHYRPFPLAPLMTRTSSPHDPALAKMLHPDVAATLAFIDDSLTVLPMKLRPGKQLAALMWSDQFSGQLNSKQTASAAQPDTGTNTGTWQTSTSRTGADIASRPVQTSTQ